MKKSVLLFTAASLFCAPSLVASAETTNGVKTFTVAPQLETPYVPEPSQADQMAFLSNLDFDEQPSRLQVSTTRLPLSRSESNQTSLAVRIDRLDRRDGTQRRGWYVFAGADDEALTFSGLTGSDIELRNHVNVGDVHVGLSFPAGTGQAALGYSRRSVEFETKTFSATVEEDILGLSYGLKF